MTYETQAFLLDIGVDYWLVGFRTVGEAIDIARINLHKHGSEPKDLYGALSEKCGANRHKLNDDIRRTVGIAWRSHRSDMEKLLGEVFEQPPAPREFVYAAADYLNRQGER